MVSVCLRTCRQNYLKDPQTSQQRLLEKTSFELPSWEADAEEITEQLDKYIDKYNKSKNPFSKKGMEALTFLIDKPINRIENE